MTAAKDSAETPEERVQEALERICSSAVFAHSPRMMRFLRLVVGRALCGEGGGVKEYVIGVEVFDKPPDFDPRLDSIVRVEARRLRRKLQQYYEREGSGDEVVLEFRKGSYVPIIRPRENAAHASESAGEPLLGRGEAVAVLPFGSLSQDAELEAFCQGLTEELIQALNKVLQLRVVSRRAAAGWEGGAHDTREFGRHFNVDRVFEGTVRRTGDRLRVSAQLVSAADGLTLWCETYERRTRDALQVQEEVARAIVRDVGARKVQSMAARRAG